MVNAAAGDDDAVDANSANAVIVAKAVAALLTRVIFSLPSVVVGL